MSFCLGAAGSHRLGRGWAWRWRCLGWSWVWGGTFRLLSCCHRLNRGRSWSHVTGAEAPKVRPKLPLFAFKCVFSSLPTLGPPNSRALKQVGPERALGPCQPQTDTCLWWAACADSCDCVPRSAQMQLGFKSPLSLTETTIPCLSSLTVKPQATTGGARIDFRPVWGAELCRAATVGELGFWGAAWVRANSGHHRPTQALPWDQVAPVSVWVFLVMAIPAPGNSVTEGEWGWSVCLAWPGATRRGGHRRHSNPRADLSSFCLEAGQHTGAPH